MLREGKLPNIARLLKDAGRATLMSSTPPLSPIAWASIITGVNPGKHGVYDFAQREPGSYDFVPNSSDPHGLAMHDGALISCDAGIHPGWPNNDSPTSGWIFRIDFI